MMTIQVLVRKIAVSCHPFMLVWCWIRVKREWKIEWNVSKKARSKNDMLSASLETILDDNIILTSERLFRTIPCHWYISTHKCIDILTSMFLELTMYQSPSSSHETSMLIDALHTLHSKQDASSNFWHNYFFCYHHITKNTHRLNTSKE